MSGPILRAACAALLALATALPVTAQDTPRNRYAFTQDYEPSPAIWRLADDDTTIYMLGTIHVLPRGFRWRSEELDAIIEQADTLVVETSEFAVEDDAVDVMGKLAHRIERRQPTSARLSQAARPLWRNLVAQSGMEFEFIDNTPVMLALLTLGMSGTGQAMSTPEYGVETVLEREFLRRSRPIESIEDSGGVMYSLLRLDSAAIVADLDARLVRWGGKSVGSFYDEDYVERVGDAYWAEEHAWAQGIVANDFNLGFGDGAIGTAMDAMLLDRRNTAWAEWLENRLDEPGTLLLAVGSGHFEGDVSLLVKLAERGLSVERVH